MKTLVTELCDSLSAADRNLELTMGDFPKGRDSTIVDRERARSKNLEGVFTLMKGKKTVEDSEHTSYILRSKGRTRMSILTAIC